MNDKLPDGWEWRKIQDITGKVEKTDPRKSPEKEFAYLDIDSIDNHINQITNPKMITGVTAPSRARQIVLPGDILFSTVRVYLKNIAIVNPSTVDQIASTGFCVIRSSQEVDSKFLFHYIKTADFIKQLEAFQRGANYPAVRDSDILNQVIPLPPLDVQQKIVSILEKAEETKRLRVQADELTQEFLKSVFLEMFGDPVKNEMGWDTKKLKNIIKSNTCNGFFAKNNEYENGNVDIIWITDFIDKLYSNTASLRKVNASNKDIEKYRVSYGDVLFCRSSLNYEGVGKVACVPKNTTENTIFECHIIKISLNLDELLPEFFQIQSTLPHFRNQIFGYAKTSTMTTISQSGITNCEIIIPPIELQQKFVDIVLHVEKTKQNQQQSSQQINTLFDSLMQKAFTGELVS